MNIVYRVTYSDEEGDRFTDYARSEEEANEIADDLEIDGYENIKIERERA